MACGVRSGTGATLCCPKMADEFYTQDIEKAKQLLNAANFDFDREYDLFTASSETWRAAGQVWANQLEKSGMKVRVDSNPSYQVFVTWAQNDWFFQISNPPGDNTPSNYMRIQHSDSWSDVYHNFALFDPEIDALIEKAEVTIDSEENVNLVKQIQMECIQKFTSCTLCILLTTSAFSRRRCRTTSSAWFAPFTAMTCG